MYRPWQIKRWVTLGCRWLPAPAKLARVGDPRGELMHLELARLDLTEGDDHHDDITTRIGELLEAHSRQWLAPMDLRRVQPAPALDLEVETFPRRVIASW